MKNTRITTCCNWIFFLIAFTGIVAGSSKQTTAQTAIANPAGTTVTTACTADTRAIGFPNGNTFTYANTAWPSCTAWGFSTTVGIPVCRANVLATTNPCVFDNVTYNAAAPTNLNGGVMCFTGTTNYRASNGTTYANRLTNIRMVVTVTDNSGNPMRLQVSGGYVYVVIPDPSFTFRAKVELQAQGPASVVYYTTGNGTTVPIGCTSNPNNSYTCANYLNTWVGAIQLYNCISTESTYKICTQFTGSTFLSGGVPAAPATPTGAATICPGGNANIVASNPASGTLYYWQTATNGTSTANPATSANYNVSPASTTTYYVRPLVGTCWGTASAGVTVTVVADPAATTPTITNATVCAGNGSTVLSSNGSGGTGAYTFTWQYNNGGTWGTVTNGTPAGATYAVAGTSPNSTLTVSNITNPGTYDYRLRITQAASGCAVNSAATTLTVVADPTAPTLNVATPASGTSVCVGATVSATFNVSSNGTGTCTNEYQSTVNNGTTWLAYTPGNPLTAGTAGTNWVRIQSRRVCSGSGCDGAGETFATVAQWTVVADPTFTLQPVAGTICTGGTRTLTATVSPVTGPVYTYDWQESNDNGVGDPWVSAVGGSGANTLSYTTPALTGNLWHRLVVTSTTGGCTTPITSSSVLTTVVADPVAPNPSITNASVCRGGSTVVSSTGSGGSGAILYQWQYNNGGTWVNTSNGTPVGFTYTNPTTASMTIATNNAITTPTGTFQFRVRVYTATSGCETFSNPVDFTVASDPTAPTLNVANPPTSSVICIGGTVSATFNVSSNGTGTCTDNYQYTLTGAAPFFPYNPGDVLTATSAGTNRIIIQTSRTCGGVACDGAGEVFATVAQWTVAADPTITTHPAPTSTICSGGAVSLSGVVTPATGPVYTYEWQESNDNGVGDAWATAIGGTGVNTLSYTTPALSSTIYYRLYITSTSNGCTTPIISNSALVTVVADPTAPDPSITNASVCRGGSTVVSSTGSGGSGTILYQWQYNNGGTWINVVNATPVGFTYATPTTASMTITTNNAVSTPTGTFQFRVRVYTATSGCETFSNPVDFTVASDPTAPTLNVASPGSGTNVCIGDQVSATFNVSSNGTGVCTDNYQYTLTGAAPFFPYTPGTPLTATSAGTNRIIIQTSRTCAGVACDGAGETFATVAQWTVLSNITGGSFVYTNPTSCTTSNGTITVTPPTGGSGTYQYSRTSTNGSNGTWQASTSFTGIADGASGNVWARNSVAPYCPYNMGAYLMQEPYEPIAAPTAVSDISDLCGSNIATLTASGLEPGSGGSNSGGAYSYNGTNQYYYNASIAGFPTGSVATVEAWVNPVNSQADATFNGIVSFGPNPASNYNRFLMSIQSNGVPSFANWNNDFVPSATTCPALPWGQWSHLCMVLNGTGANNISFYINGNLAVTGTTNNAALTNLLASGRITIGCTDPAGGRYFEGSIANVRVWNVARTQAQIQTDMYLEVPTVTTGLVARYNFNANANCQNNATYNLTAVNAPVSVTPAFYTYTWTGAVPSGSNPTPSTTNEVQITGALTGTSSMQVTASANGCNSIQSAAVPINDFGGAYIVVLEAAGSGNAVNVVLPGNSTGPAYGRPGVGAETSSITASGGGAWDRCVNWGLPVTSNGTYGPRVGFGSANINMNYLAQGQLNSTTNLPSGIVCYTASVPPPTNRFCQNTACTAWLSANLNIRVTLTLLTPGNVAIPLDYTSSGHIVMRAAQNFKIRQKVEIQAPAAAYYGSGVSSGGGVTCNNYSTAGTWYPILEWYDCIYKSTAPQFFYSFNYNSFPKFSFTSGIDAGTDFTICVGGQPASRIDLQGDLGSLSATCGTLLHFWEGPSGYVSAGTLLAPTGTQSPPSFVTSTSPTTFGTYNYTVSQGPAGTSNICYGTSSVNITQNVAVVNGGIWSNGAPGTTYYGTPVPAYLDPSSQVTGNDSWYDNRNWDHCVPDAATNSYILYNATNPANINSNVTGYWGSNAATKFLKIDVPNNAKLMINANGTTKLNVTD
ncbi:MAG: hypothetical protein POELPBGB_00055 [Bacteroidia bacterium]|nr:hypothetical protein [Bacteroidia bacterium]